MAEAARIDFAGSQRLSVKQHLPCTADIIEQIDNIYGPEAAYQAGLAVAYLKARLEKLDVVPDSTAFRSYMDCCPEALPMLEQAFEACLREHQHDHKRAVVMMSSGAAR